MYWAIEAKLIIHNICVDLRDPAEENGVDWRDEEGVAPDQARRDPQPQVDWAELRAGGLVQLKQLVDYWSALH